MNNCHQKFEGSIPKKLIFCFMAGNFESVGFFGKLAVLQLFSCNISTNLMIFGKFGDIKIISTVYIVCIVN